MEMVTASGSAKIANLSSNLAALVSMMLSGDVCFPLAIPAMVFSIAGGYLGAKFAIKRGAKARARGYAFGFGGNFGEIGLSIVKPIARFARLTYGSICLQGENACEKNC